MEDEAYQAGRDSSAVGTWGPPAAAALLIFVLSTIPGGKIPEHPDLVSTAVHVAEFGILSFLVARALAISGLAVGKVSTLLWAVLICSAYGFLDEARQFLVPNRVFDVLDILADAFGSLAGAGIYILRAGTGARDAS